MIWAANNTMKDLNSIQQALINIFKVSIKEDSLGELVRTCHIELEKLMGNKAKNFYLAVYVGDSNYTLPYYRDEKNHGPLNEPISFKGGLTDYIRKSGKTECIDAKKFDALVAMTEGKIKKVVGENAYEWVGAPLIYQDDVHGVLVVQTYDDTIHYTEEDVELIDYVSKNLALAIERKEKDRELNNYKENLEKKVQKKSKELLKKNTVLKREIAKVKRSEKIQKVLYNISEAKSNTKNLRDLLSKIHEQVDTLMDASNFYVAIVVDKEKGLFRLPYIVDENPEEIENPDDIVDLAGGFTDYVLKTQTPLLADQKRVKKLEKSSAVKQVGIVSQSWLGIPLKTPGGEILGVVAVQSYTDPHAFTQTDADILSIISTTIAGAVKYKELEEEKNSLEEKLLESQKMEAVGVLAAGVAHEFNNLLSIIIGHAYNGMKACEEKNGNYKRYSKIEKASERAAEIIEKLMVFAQKRERGRYFINDMTRAINEAVVKARNSIPAGCNISVNIKETLWPVKIDREEIDDVLSNILDNALRAVDGMNNGIIKISAENFKGRPIHSPLKEACKYIYIKIEDNGRGMDEETRSQIFNPFFTTRDPGKGTGMGLAIVYTILKEYYGTIDVESEKGKGTAVHIYLPTISFLS